jgi:hypothetical protein
MTLLIPRAMALSPSSKVNMWAAIVRSEGAQK